MLTILDPRTRLVLPYRSLPGVAWRARPEFGWMSPAPPTVLATPVTPPQAPPDPESADPERVDAPTAATSLAELPALYEEYADRTLAFLVSLGLRRADAEDVHHEAWMKIVRKLGDAPLVGNFRAWMFQVMRNAAYDAMRRKRPTPTEDAAIEAAAGEAPAPAAEESMIQREYQDALAACLERLDEVRQGLVRGRLAGDDYPEIAKRLDIQVARAHRLFFSAKQSLTQCVQTRMGEAT
ncbi:MAG: sigma-70 family RNA polymerase sigma factor [Planctomycetota bacterium]